MTSLSQNDIVLLRPVLDEDLTVFFENQLDPIANRMAAFTHKDPSDRAAFDAHWAKILADEQNINRTILVNGRAAGNIAKFPNGDHTEVCYWLGQEFWGRGIATEALRQLLEVVTERPIYAGAAKDNHGSIRVLEKCGFRLCDERRGFANARGEEIDEVLLVLG